MVIELTSARVEADAMLSVLTVQAELTNPDIDTVDRARVRLVAALMELADDPSFSDVHADATVILDRLAEMLEDPATALGW